MTSVDHPRSETRLRGLALAVLAVLWSVAQVAGAVQVRDVRVGEHPEFTRIVFELDGAAQYTVRSPGSAADADVLVVDLDAQSYRRVLTSRSRLVESVRIEPGLEGSVVRIQLRDAPVRVADMVLSDPDRIVLDLKPGAPAPARSEPAPPRTPQASAPPPDDASEPDALASEDSVPGTAEELPLELKPPEPAVEATPRAGAEAPEDTFAEAEELVDEVEELVAEAEDLVADSERARTVTGAEEAAEPSAAAHPTSPVRERPPATRPMSGGAKPADGGLLGGDRVLVAAALAGLVVLSALLLWVRARRRAGADELPEYVPDDEPEPVVHAASEEGLREMAMPHAEELESTRPSLFDAPYPPPERESSTVIAEPTPPPGPMAEAGEFERRIEELEKRVDEAIQAKERFERQLAAQTEELRVQRAAIARTQRVLRTLSRPEDGATEPAPKSDA